MTNVSATADGPQPTTPVVPRFHGMPLSGIDATPGSRSAAGRFGRMFRNVPLFEHGADNLAALARTMVLPFDSRDREPVTASSPPNEHENPLIPAGYTYLGQYVDHDITFDPVSSLQRQNDPDALDDFRTPRFDLDSLYGRGPADQPYLYRNGQQPDPHPVLGFDQRGVMLLHGENRADPADAAAAAFIGPDLPRNAQGRALIGDPRNDENLIVSQLHVLFMRFHNRMVEHVFAQTGATGDDLLKDVQRLVRWHYQWIIVHDLLPRIVDGDRGDGSTADRGVVGDILRAEQYATGGGGTGTLRRPHLRFYRWHDRPFMPIEFSVAAYRYGHSMVRPSYFFNDFVKEKNGNVRIPLFSPSTDPIANLNGFRPLPGHWGFQWKYFFDVDPAVPAERSYKIGTRLSAPLGNLPAAPDMPNLAQRNLMRALRLSVPSGQNVARAMGIAPLSDAELDLGGRGAPDFDGDAPLWFYVLREAELRGGSQHLGPVGGRIVAEVLVGLLAGDPLSWLNVEPNWQPALARDGRFGMPELIRFVNDGVAAAPVQPPAATGQLERWRATFGPPAQ